MNVVVSVEQRYDRTPDGAVWTSSLYPYAFWTRYLDVFDSVRVVARARDVTTVPSNWERVDGDGVSILGIPYYHGLWQYARRFHRVRRVARRTVEPVDAVILRVPSWVGSYLASVLLPIGHPYGVEVVGDPYDLFAPGAVRHPLRPFLRWSSPRTLRWTCSGASAAAYVAEETLQRRYPCLGYCTSYSSVEISDADLVMAPRSLRPDGRALILVTVGSLAQPYKGVDVLISAVGGCVREGLNLRLVVVGDGRYRQELEARAAALGLGDCVRFTGQLTSREAVRAELDVADLFALASLTEGLPRAMIEAMARGLPCIGTTVGGIPELLPPDAMVPPGDAAALAELIRAVVMDPIRMATMSARNLAKARKYHKDILQARRRAFYRQVHERTAQWLKSQATDLLLQPARDA